MPKIENGILVVSAPLWAKYRDAKAKASAAEREVKAIAAEIGMPSADELAEALELSRKGDKGEIVIHDGNGAPIGKVSVFKHPGAEIPAGWRKRES